jgi:hypothetical protein
MQSAKHLITALRQLADQQRYLFTPADMQALLPLAGTSTFKSLLSRLVTRGELERVCRGLYRPVWIAPVPGLILYHAAARLRAGYFLYLSLESVLSEIGVISQIPLQRITLMTSGRDGEISCGRLGVIEFTHTRQRPEKVVEHLIYDRERRLWCADREQALRDLRRTRRNLDLIQEELDESV